MLKIHCSECKFKGEKEYIPVRCPYCHRIGTLGEMSTAQELIDEVL